MWRGGHYLYWVSEANIYVYTFVLISRLGLRITTETWLGFLSRWRRKRAPPTLHSRSILGATTDNEGQYEMKTRLEKTLSEQLLALSIVVCYGSSMWCREEDLNLHGFHLNLYCCICKLAKWTKCASIDAPLSGWTLHIHVTSIIMILQLRKLPLLI